MSDFKIENGTTRLVFGSHLWSANRDSTLAQAEEIALAETKRGSIVMWLGKTVHGLGANFTDQPRQTFATSYVVDWLTQEENQYLLYPAELARHFPEVAQCVLGYRAKIASDRSADVATNVFCVSPSLARQAGHQGHSSSWKQPEQ